VQLYYFYSPTCPHCQAAKPFLDSLPERFPWIEVQRFSVKDNRINARFYYETAKALGVEALSVPGFAFCRQVLIGYDTAETTGAEIARALEACHAERVSAAAAPAGAGPGLPGTPPGAEISAGRPAGTTVHLPIIGTIDAQALSLPVMTVMLAGVDAFNPCAFFVLLFLLSLLVHAKSRARMLVIGGTFVLFSGIIYFVFMAAWLNVFLIAGELRVITAIAGLVALTIGALNIKDFFLFKQGPSLSIPESAKPGLFKRMREIVSTGNMLPMFASTVVLAIVANSYELLCTAGFPMVYTRTLTLADLEPWQYYAWLAAYNVIYVLPLLAIVLVFTYTMGSRKLAESEGRALKLVSGCMMFGFGLLLLVAPNLLTNALASIAVLAVAVGVALLTAMLARPKPA
jgi:glutaredoxin